jgi:transposase-like protein
MDKKARKPEPAARSKRRVFTDEFRREAVQMMLDGHTAASVAERLGIAGTNVLYRWKREELERTGPVATSLEARVRELEIELHRVERERDILKKALVIFGRQE